MSLSLSLQTAESLWLAQLTEMRQVISDLKCNQLDPNVQEYGHNILLDNAQLLERDNKDIWNAFNEEGVDGDYGDQSNDSTDEIQKSLDETHVVDYENGPQWLKSKCLAFASKGLTLDAAELQQQLTFALASDMKGFYLLAIFDLFG